MNSAVNSSIGCRKLDAPPVAHSASAMIGIIPAVAHGALA